MSQARGAILGRLRSAAARTADASAAAEAAVAARLSSPTANLVPARGQVAPEARIELFTTLARAVQAEVERIPGLAELPAAVAAFLRRLNLPQKLVMAPEPLLEQADWTRQPLLRLRLRLRLRRGTAEARDDVGLTLAMAGIAETGTLLLASSAAAPTLLAFLPETSIVVLPARAIDASYEASWARLRRPGKGLPRSVNLITGPSRTGDIAQKIELGAHGPRRLCIMIVDDLPATGDPPTIGGVDAPADGGGASP